MLEILMTVRRIFWLAVACALAWTPARAQTVTDAFSGTTAAQTWTVYGGACLTAGNNTGSIPACANGSQGGLNGNAPDVNGSGVLRLTQALTNQSGGIISNGTVSSANGFSVSFVGVSYGGNGADGISLLLLDGSKPVPASLGNAGGGLSYQNLSGGYLGFGIDEFGNFALAGCGIGSGCVNGIGFTANSLIVRGPTASSNPYIASYVPGFSLWNNVTTRAAATSHAYVFTVSASGNLRVTIDGILAISTNLTATAGPVPATMRIGFASSTGGSTNIHSVRSLSVTSFAPMAISKTSTVISDPFNGTTNPKAIPGATVRYCVALTNPAVNPTSTGNAITDPIGALPVTFLTNSIRINGTLTGSTCNWNGAAGGSFAGNVVSANVNDLAPGASTTMYFDTVVN